MLRAEHLSVAAADQQPLTDLLISLGGRDHDGELGEEVRRLETRALLGLAMAAEPRWSIPRGKRLRARCEHCGKHFEVERRRARLARGIAWGELAIPANWTASTLETALKRALRSAGVPDDDRARFTLDQGRVVRWMIVCGGCSERRIKRCRRDEPDGARCAQPARPGAGYCDDHRGARPAGVGPGYRAAAARFSVERG